MTQLSLSLLNLNKPTLKGLFDSTFGEDYLFFIVIILSGGGCNRKVQTDYNKKENYHLPLLYLQIQEGKVNVN